MTNNLTLALIILIFILLVAIVNIVVSIIERRKLITKINTLWDNKSKLESFIRLTHDLTLNIKRIKTNLKRNIHLSMIKLGPI